MKAEHEAFRNFWWNAYNLYTNSLSFWPIYHRRSTEIPPTINGQRIGRVSAAISTEISADSQSICRPSLDRYLGWYIGRYVDWCIGRHIDGHSTDMSTDISADTWPLCRPIHRSSVGRYVDRDVHRYIGRGVHKIHMIRELQGNWCFCLHKQRWILSDRLQSDNPFLCLNVSQSEI